MATMTDLALQVSDEQADALGKLAAAMAEENGDFGFFGNRVTALLTDRAALLERCKRAEERAAVAEKAVELAARRLGDTSLDCPYAEGVSEDQDRGGCLYCSIGGDDCSNDKDGCCWNKQIYREARAALGLPAAPASAGTEGGE